VATKSRAPASIRIGPIDFAVDVREDLREDDRALDGQIRYGETTIRLHADLAHQAQVQTLLHEVVHGMLTQMGRAKMCKDEELVDALAFSLYQVIRDNPDLVRMIMEKKR
jgi:hypothetical protein